MEKFTKSVNEGLNELKKLYPNDIDQIDYLMKSLHNQNKSSKNQIVNELENKLCAEDLDDDLKDSFVKIIINSIQNNESIIDSLIIPLLAYLESCANDKVFLESPFLCLNIPKGRHTLKGKVFYKNILEKEGTVEQDNNEFAYFETIFESTEDFQVTMKDFIDIRRGNNG